MVTIKNIQSASIAVPQMEHHFNTPLAFQNANTYPLPDAFTVQVVSGAAGVTKRVYLFNQDAFENVTSNGTAAITYSYPDGYNGKVISRLLSQARAGVGAVCYGFDLRFNITSTGAGSASAVMTANPQFIARDAFGTPIIQSFPISGQSRSDQDASIQHYDCIFNISGFAQFSFSLPPLTTASATFYLQPNMAMVASAMNTKLMAGPSFGAVGGAGSIGTKA